MAWIFEQKGLIVVPKKDEEKVLEIAIEKGAEDAKEYESEIEVITDPSQFEEIKKALENAGIEIISAKVTMVPKTTVPVEDEATANSILKFMEALEELDDVQQVYANFDIPEKIMENLNK